MSIWAGRPARPSRAGRPPKLSDAELLTMAVAQVLLGVRSEARWLRFLPRVLPGAFPYLPGQSGYNKRLRAAVPLLKRAIRAVAADTDLWSDTTWVVDSTPGSLRSGVAAGHGGDEVVGTAVGAAGGAGDVGVSTGPVVADRGIT